MPIVKEQTRRHVAGHVDIGPAVVVEIRCRHTQAVSAAWLENACCRGHFSESAVPVVVIKNVLRQREPSRPAHDRYSLPNAKVTFARTGRVVEVEINIIRYEQIYIAVTIVVNEAAPGAVPRAGDRKLGCLRCILKLSVAAVPIQDVMPEVGDQKIGPTVVVVICDTHALTPPRVCQS